MPDYAYDRRWDRAKRGKRRFDDDPTSRLSPSGTGIAARCPPRMPATP